MRVSLSSHLHKVLSEHVKQILHINLVYRSWRKEYLIATIDRLFGDIHPHFHSWDVNMSILLSYKLWRLSSTRNLLIVQYTCWSLSYDLANLYIINPHVILYNMISIHFINSLLQITSEYFTVRHYFIQYYKHERFCYQTNWVKFLTFSLVELKKPAAYKIELCSCHEYVFKKRKRMKN